MRIDSNGRHYYTPEDVSPGLWQRAKHRKVTKDVPTGIFFTLMVVGLILTFLSM